MREVTTLIVHCSATKPDMDIGADEIRDWHVNDNGWSDIGYHWVIRRGGTIDVGRDEEIQGAHARGHNADSIGVCMVGGINDAGDPDCNFTADQWAALEAVVRSALDQYGDLQIIGHRDVSTKDCPCFDVGAWAARL